MLVALAAPEKPAALQLLAGRGTSAALRLSQGVQSEEGSSAGDDSGSGNDDDGCAAGWRRFGDPPSGASAFFDVLSQRPSRSHACGGLAFEETAQGMDV